MQPTLMPEFGALLEAAQSTLYRTNCFRLLGIPVDAAAKEINRQIQRIEIAQKFGVPGEQPLSAILPSRSASPSMLHEIRQRLGNPELRLIDEFFWFWPEVPHGSESDLAIAAMKKGELQSASEIWLGRAQSITDTAAIHNLAVLFHFQALDYALAGSGEDTFSEAVWSSAWNYWRTLVGHDAFWRRLTSRIEELDDPRLTGELSSQIRSSLLLANLRINISLAIAAAEAGQLTKTSGHLEVARQSGLPVEVVRRQSERAMVHVRTRIENLCADVDRKLSNQIERAPLILETLLREITPHLHWLDEVLGPASQVCKAAHDQIVQTARRHLIAYGNKTSAWTVCEEILVRIQPLVMSESLKTILADDLARLAQMQHMTACWFCKQTKGNDLTPAVVDMHGEVIRLRAWEGERLHWRHLPVKVPRCRRCRNIHGLRKVTLAIGGAAIAAIVTWAAGQPAISAFFTTCAAWLGTIVARRVNWPGSLQLPNSKRMRVLKEMGKYGHPLIQQMRSRSWQFGKRPRDARSEVSGIAVLKFAGWFALFLVLTFVFSTIGAR